MELNRKSYPAKLLLFGEYTVILGSKALAMPLPQFSGHWEWNNGNMDSDLKLFFHYLQQNQFLPSQFDVAEMDKQLQAGLRFASNIPQGYGLGSSGALCAAVYDAFALEKSENLKELKQIFAQMESHFHGSSSGADPLICYLEQAVLMEEKQVRIVKEFVLPHAKEIQFFLLDVGFPRKTEPLVTHFLECCKSEPYRNHLEQTLLSLVEEMMEAVLQSKTLLLLEIMHEISFFQLRFFERMLPKVLQPLWKEGLESDWFKLKLCGAGGGGFFLGVTNDFEKMKRHTNFKVIPII